MALFYLLIFAILIVGVRFRHRYLHGDYIDVPHANAVKGFFILLVFASHIQGFLLRNGYAYTSLDRVFVGANAWLGQLIVSMFLFYSGYGVMESIRKKGSSYVDDLPKKRIAVVLLDFDIAVLVYVLFNLLFSHFPGWKTVLLSLICWESVGNSNWYIFVILLCYVSAYVSYKFISRLNIIFIFFLCAVIAAILSFAKPFWWYDTIMTFPIGMLFSLHRNLIERLLSRHYTLTLLSLVLIFLCVRQSSYVFPFLWHGLRSNMLSGLFVLIIVLITQKCEVSSAALTWCGRNLFPLYIYQRLSMMIWQSVFGGVFVCRHATIYVFTCLLSTVLIALIYRQIKSWKFLTWKHDIRS